MPSFQRASDVIEILAEKSLFLIGGGVAFGVLAGLGLKYQGVSDAFGPVSIIFALISVALLGTAAYTAWGIRKVAAYAVTCSYCEAVNTLTSAPDADFICTECKRMVPVKDGAVLPVQQVRCGYCNGLNYYSEKTEVLLCEECNREIPIARDEDPSRPSKKLMAAFAVVDDEAPYELVLTGKSGSTEELVECLQHMLALNRNQVKSMLDEMPVVLLQGIPKQKATMLKAQISVNGGLAEARAMATEAVA